MTTTERAEAAPAARRILSGPMANTLVRIVADLHFGKDMEYREVSEVMGWAPLTAYFVMRTVLDNAN